MRWVWVVIPLVLFGIIGIQESFATEPHYGDISISISKLPNLGETVVVTVTNGDIKSEQRQGLDTVILSLSLSSQFEFVDLEPTRTYSSGSGNYTVYEIQMDIINKDSISFSTTIKAIGEGNGRVRGGSEYNSMNTGAVIQMHVSENTIPGAMIDPTKQVNPLQISPCEYVYDPNRQGEPKPCDDYPEPKPEPSSKPVAIHLSPKKQLEFGVTPVDIICKEGLELIFKYADSSPACVTPETAEKLIERGWTSNEKNTKNILLYSSKMDDTITNESSAPSVAIPYDQKVTLSKIPKLGETATLSITLTLKPEFSQLSGNSPTQKIMLENGFSFVNIDVSSLTLAPTTNLMSYSESLPVVMNVPTVFQAEITPTQVGNWTVYVDGGNYKQHHSFYFIVTDDETILGEKPRAPSGIGRTVPAEDDFIISKIDPETGEEIIVDEINSILSDDYLDIELDPILYSGGPVSSKMIEIPRVTDSSIAMEPTIFPSDKEIIISNLPRVDDIIDITFIATYQPTQPHTFENAIVAFHITDTLEFLTVPEGYELEYTEPQSSWGKQYPGIYSLKVIEPIIFDSDVLQEFTVQAKAVSEGITTISAGVFDEQVKLDIVIGSTETLLRNDYYVKYPQEIPESIQLPTSPEEQAAFEKKYGVSFGTTTIKTNITEEEHRIWLENYGMSEDEIVEMMERVFG